MRVAGMREVRANAAALLQGESPVLVTKHGKIAGVYLPLENPDVLPEDLRLELAGVLGKHLASQLSQRGVSETTLQKDFDEFRRGRRRR